MLVTTRHNSSNKTSLDGFDIIEQEHKLNIQLLELSKVQAGVENMSNVYDYVVTTIDNKQPIVKELVNSNIHNSLELMGLDKYDVLDGTESFSSIIHKISDFVNYIIKAAITIIKKIIEFITNIIKAIIDFFKNLFKSEKKSGGGNGGSARDRASDQIKKVENTLKEQRNNTEKLSKKKMKTLDEDIESLDKRIKNTLEKLPTYLLETNGNDISIETLIKYTNKLKASISNIADPHEKNGYMYIYDLSHKYGDSKNENLGLLISTQLENLIENSNNEMDLKTSVDMMFNSKGETFMKVIDNMVTEYYRNSFKISLNSKEFEKISKIIDLNGDTPEGKNRSISSITTKYISYIEYPDNKHSQNIANKIDDKIKILYETHTKGSLPNRNENYRDREQELLENADKPKEDGTITVVSILKTYLELVNLIYEGGKITIAEKTITEEYYKNILNKVNIKVIKNTNETNKIISLIRIFFTEIKNINEIIKEKERDLLGDLDHFNDNMDLTLKNLNSTLKKYDSYLKNASNLNINSEKYKTLTMIKSFSSVYTKMSKDTCKQTKELIDIMKHHYISQDGKHPFKDIETLENLLLEKNIKTIIKINN